MAGYLNKLKATIKQTPGKNPGLRKQLHAAQVGTAAKFPNSVGIKKGGQYGQKLFKRPGMTSSMGSKPGAPGAAGATVAGGPPPPRTNPLPWNAQYETSVGGLNRAHDLSNATLGQEELQAKQGYGFDEGFNDPTANPFSRAALMQRTYDQQRNRTLNSYAGAGQLYSGAVDSARNFDRFNYEQGVNTERTAYASQLQDIANRRQEADNTRDTGIAQAEADRLADAAATPPDPAEAPADYSQVLAQIAQAVKPKKKKGKK